MKFVNTLWNDERGQDLIEYALMAGFLAVAAAATVPGVTTSIKTLLGKIQTNLDGVK